MNYTPVFNNFIEPARKKASLWKFIFATIFIIAVYLILSISAFVIITLIVSEFHHNIFSFGTPESMVVLFGTFAFLIIAVSSAVALFHKQSPVSLLGGTVFSFLRNFLIAFTILIVIIFIIQILFPQTEKPIVNLGFNIWLSWLPIAVILIFMQVSAEELLFRGYFIQQLAILSKSFWIWMVLPSIVFGMLHYQPATWGNNAWLVVVQITLIGLLLTDLTYRTGNLGAAIGVHFANNILPICYQTFDGVLSGFALYLIPIATTDSTAIYDLLITEITITIILLIIYALVVIKWFDTKSTIAS